MSSTSSVLGLEVTLEADAGFGLLVFFFFSAEAAVEAAAGVAASVGASAAAKRFQEKIGNNMVR